MQAVLWDMDGLLVDSEPLWTIAEVELAADLGGTWSEEIKARVVGTRLDVAVPAILSWFDVEPTADRVAATSARLTGRMVELVAGELPLMPGAAALLAELRDNQIPVALVSSSYRDLVDAVLSSGAGPFDASLAGDEVVHGKPHPEPYLTTAARLGVDPARCVVLEDSPPGVASGRAAGCAVVAVPSVPGVRFSAQARTLIAASLKEVDLATLRSLVRP